MKFSSFFSSKKPSLGFNLDDFYADFSETLTERYLPLLEQSLSSTAPSSGLSANVELVLNHFISHYGTLEHAADATTTAHLVFTSWPTLETPFLFLGDIHPYLITDLLRNFINQENQDSEYVSIDLNTDVAYSLEIVNAWKDPSEQLETRINEIEFMVRTIVPNLLKEARIAHRDYVARVSDKWISTQHSHKTMALTTREMKKVLGIVLKVHWLTKKVLTDMVEVMNDNQRALFLKAICKVLVGINDMGSNEKRDNNVLLSNFISGVVSVPSYFLVVNNMTKKERILASSVFVSSIFGATLSTLNAALVRKRHWTRSLQDSIWECLCFFIGGIIPLLSGIFIPNKVVKISITFVLTIFLIALVLFVDYKIKPDQKKKENAWILLIATICGISASVGFSDLVHRLR